MAVYDFCSFLNENDLYEIRLNQHWDFVDKFIVVEAGETHTGLKKPLKFDHERFKAFSSKIEYRTFSSFDEEMAKYPELVDQGALDNIVKNGKDVHIIEDWKRCFFQDNYVVKVLSELKANDDDIIYASCLDEMIKKDAFARAAELFKNKSTIYRNDLRPVFFFNLYLYAYKVNLLHKHWTEHYAGLLTEVGNFKKVLPASIRYYGLTTHPIIGNGGWHFTFLDNTNGEMVLEKQRSWAHSKDRWPGQKVKFDHTTKEEALRRFFEDYKVTQVAISEETHPKYLVDNIDKFKDFIFKEN